MATIIAVHKVVVSDPTADLVFTGKYDTAGNAMFKKASLAIKPGAFFEFDDPIELERLISLGAVRHPSAQELALHERGLRAEAEEL